MYIYLSTYPIPYFWWSECIAVQLYSTPTVHPLYTAKLACTPNHYSCFCLCSYRGNKNKSAKSETFFIQKYFQGMTIEKLFKPFISIYFLECRIYDQFRWPLEN